MVVFKAQLQCAGMVLIRGQRKSIGCTKVLLRGQRKRYGFRRVLLSGQPNSTGVTVVLLWGKIKTMVLHRFCAESNEKAMV